MSSKKESAKEVVARVLYQARPSKNEEQIALLIHSIILSEGFNCIGAHENEPETDKLLILPQKWAEHKADGIYGFKYRSPDRKNILQLKIVVIDDAIDVNCVYDKKPDTILSGGLKLKELDSVELDTVLNQIKTQLKDSIWTPIGITQAKVFDSNSPPGYNLKPVPLHPSFPGIFGPPRRDIDPLYDIRPNVGGGDLGFGVGGNQMGPEHPYFDRHNQRLKRDEPHGFLPPKGFGGMFGGPGGNQPMG